MSNLSRKMFKVVCPIERKDGTTHWLRIGSGYANRDQSTNIYLDALPANMRLQIRELDEEDLNPKSERSARQEPSTPVLPL